MKTTITRREVLTRIAALGGSIPLVRAMGVLGLMHHTDPAMAKFTNEDNFDPTLGFGRKVAIIGAGLSGLTAAYELSRRGFECQIFEADNRAKGRTFTVRPDGSSDSWYQEVGREPETCNFDEVDGKGSLYFEAGAGRIPSHHRKVLYYCKKFGVDLQSYIFASRANLVRSDGFNGGRPVQLRRFKHNLRGYLAEMFRTADSSRLDGRMPKDEQEKLLDALSRSFGELNPAFVYQGGARVGYQPPGPGAGNQSGEFWKPFAFVDLLRADKIWGSQLFNDMRYLWQTSLMQPVGGIDNIAAAFMRQPARAGLRVGNLIRLHRKVISIRRQRSGNVRIVHQDVDQLGKRRSRKEERFDADYCISTITPSLLHNVDNNFNKGFRNALLQGVTNVPVGKVAWQCDRFWESDKYEIYGGISWTADPISQIWYPSVGFHDQRGILTGGYYRDAPDATVHFGDLPRNQRIAEALQQGIKLHPELNPSGYPYNDVSKAMTIAWQNMPFQDGGWCKYTDEQRKTGYQVMLAGQWDRFFMAGDAMSYMPGWMEGAITAGLMARDNVLKATAGVRAVANG